MSLLAAQALTMPFSPLNWYAGWTMILWAFVTGAGIGLYFHREDWLGGYLSFRRRILRLGHIALAALGMMNVLYSLSPWPASESYQATQASWGLLVGGVAMPAVCFLTAYRQSFRHLFFVPVSALVIATLSILMGAPP